MDQKQIIKQGLTSDQMQELTTLWDQANQLQKAFIQAPKLETYNKNQ